tara:strand:- start:3497 stop:3610 length:114 start_codon:yes stop_codon:yes gene_type:complete
MLTAILHNGDNAEACLVTSGIGAVAGELDSSGSTMPT